MEENRKLELLKQAWKEVFEVENVADDADFFAEGGDSIKAVQLASWLIQKGYMLELGKIFQTPVLSEMALSLEETDPVYVPEELMTKEKMGQMMKEASTQNQGGMPRMPFPRQMNSGDQQVCDQEKVGGAKQQVCDPEKMGGAKQQVCDPDKMQAADQQLCDPDRMNGYNPMQSSFESEWNTMLSVFQTMLSQQQVMLQMMQLMMNRKTNHARFSGEKGGRAGMPFGNEKALRERMQDAFAHKADAPIENPNVIEITPAKVAKPEFPAEEVLDHVLNGIFKNGFNKEEDLFAQGLTSLDSVKMVTRCGEHGYTLSMQDIYMHSTYDELLNCMKPGK